MIAAPVPIRGHFSKSMSAGVAGVMRSLDWMLLLTKTVLLMFTFLPPISPLQYAFCSAIGEFPLFGWIGG